MLQDDDQWVRRESRAFCIYSHLHFPNQTMTRRIAILNRNRNRNRKALLAFLVCLVAQLSVQESRRVAAFQPNLATRQTNNAVVSRARLANPLTFAGIVPPEPLLLGSSIDSSSVIRSRMVPPQHETDTETNTSPANPETTTTKATATATDNFDGEGFVGYLLPYAAALIGSVLATAAVFKFVLLDYWLTNLLTN